MKGRTRPDGAAVQASLQNALSGGEEPIWTTDLIKLAQDCGFHPEVMDLIREVAEIRLRELGSVNPIEGGRNG